MASNDIHFVAQDTANNIARIKAASWKVLAAEAATFAFIAINTAKGEGDLSSGLVHAGFYSFSVFLAYVVCREYPKKLKKYRIRLGKALQEFDDKAKKIHGEIGSIPNQNCGDRIYFCFCLLYFLFFIVLYSRAYGGFEWLQRVFV